ncbi:hypothetical protein HDV05_006103 [Chytridiales sp. JEL 0842]|nr:hypothetical protein HDV05_006103 [Chytridiales sp. JEL 0842]
MTTPPRVAGKALSGAAASSATEEEDVKVIGATAAVDDDDGVKVENGETLEGEECFRSFFEEAAELDSIIKQVITFSHDFFNEYLAMHEDELVSKDQQLKQDNARAMFPLLKRSEAILTKYQEQSTLLDPHLENLVTPLIEHLRRATVRLEDVNTAGGTSAGCLSRNKIVLICWALQPAHRILYLLTKVRGYKTIVKFFSHEASDLEPTLHHLLHCPDDFFLWETRYILLVWLSLIVMIPFDLISIDSSAMDPTGTTKGLIQSIIDTAKNYLAFSGKEHEAAAILLTRLLTRRDTINIHLKPFLDWCNERAMECTKNDVTSSVYILRGILYALCALYKLGPRELLLPTLAMVLPICRDLLGVPWVKSNGLIRKLVIKLAQRIGLSSLKPKLAKWRYQRGNRSLAANLAKTKGAPDSATATPKVPQLLAEDDEEDYDIPEEIEEIVELLLTGLRDKDTIVRWSAAKGIGRLSSRLPQEFATEVVASVISLFPEDTFPRDDGAGYDISAVSDYTWHGACLAIAELARRGLLMPDRLKEVVPWISLGLLFDLKRGSHSVGAHVRDASCYVCWSFARAYDPTVLLPHIPYLARRLVVSSALDREVNVRRAASAAFQEAVGRLGGDSCVPHGIEIIPIADYFSLGNRNAAVLDVAISIAQFKEYRYDIINHIVTVMTMHWDKVIRSLASKALYKLASLDLDYLLKSSLPKLIPRASSTDLNTRTGSILAIGEICLAWSTIRRGDGVRGDSAAWYTDEELETLIKPISNIVPLYPPHLLETFGSDLTRIALCHLVSCVAQSDWPLNLETSPVPLSTTTPSHLKSWWTLVHSSLERREEPVQESGAVACASLSTFCWSSQSSHLPLAQFAQSILDGLAPNRNPVVRRGYAMAVGKLGKGMTGVYAEALVRPLIGMLKGIRVKDGVVTDAEGRRNAVLGVTGLILGLEGGVKDAITKPLFEDILDAFFVAMEDYSIDQRGDVGSWVREACFTSWTRLLPFFAALENNTINNAAAEERYITPATVTRILIALARQSVEKIDRVRQTAGESLANLIWDDAVVGNGNVPAHILSALRTAVPTVNYICWINPSEVFERMVPLLDVEELRVQMLMGIVTAPEAKERVSTPLIEVADILIGSYAVAKVVEAGWIEGATRLFEAVKAEVLGSKDVKKLMAGLKVFCGLAILESASADVVRKRALTQSVIYLAHPYPRMRRASSEGLYLALTTGMEAEEMEGFEELEDILVSTDWDRPVAELKPVRERVASLLGVSVPGMKKAN